MPACGGFAYTGVTAIDEMRLRTLLDDVQHSRLPIAEAVERLRHLPYEDLGDFARIDHHRALRDALPEVVLAQGKTPEQTVAAATAVLEQADRLLVTRTAPATVAALQTAIPDLRLHAPSSACSVDRRADRPPPLPGVLLVSGGTADLPVLAVCGGYQLI